MTALKAFIDNLRPDQQEKLRAAFDDLHRFHETLDDKQKEFLNQQNLDGLAKDILIGDAEAVYFGQKDGKITNQTDREKIEV